MKQKDFITIKEYFYWCYSNVGMAHAAIKYSHVKYERLDFMIRSKLYKGLCNGDMKIQTLYDDEKQKLKKQSCVYCGSTASLSLDHLVAKSKGGSDSGDNIVYSCKKCNSSKNDKDLIEWYLSKNTFPPILVLRRYLKLAELYFENNNILNKPYSEILKYTQLYKIDLLPYNFPEPEELIL